MKSQLACDPPIETEAGSARQRSPAIITGVVVGRLVGMENAGGPVVDFAGNTSGEALAALSVIELTKNDVGREIILMFEEGDPSRPIVMGLVQHAASPTGAKRKREITIDGERLILTAEREIILRCGKASITLTRAGKVLIRGAYLLSRSSGANRIKGGSVQIN